MSRLSPRNCALGKFYRKLLVLLSYLISERNRMEIWYLFCCFFFFSHLLRAQLFCHYVSLTIMETGIGPWSLPRDCIWGDPLVGCRFSCSRDFMVCGKDYTVPIKLLLSEQVSTTKRKGLQEMRTKVGNLLRSVYQESISVWSY